MVLQRIIYSYLNDKSMALAIKNKKVTNITDVLHTKFNLSTTKLEKSQEEFNP